MKSSLLKSSFLCLLVTSVVVVGGCRSKKYEDRIAQLEEELQGSNRLLSRSDSTMSLIMVMLDSVSLNEELLTTLNQTGEHQDSVLQRIETAKMYIAYSREKIALLETDLEKEVANSASSQKKINGLMATIRKLKQDLQTKEDSLVALNGRVLNLEADNSRLVTTLQQTKQELTQTATTLSEKDRLLAEKEELLERQKEETELQARAARRQEAEKYYALGQQEEALGDKVKLAPNKKKAYYEAAESYYQQAYELGKNDAKDAMYKVKLKIK